MLAQSHRKDAFIEFIKSLLAAPFVLHMRDDAQRRLQHYGEVMDSLSQMIHEHRELAAREDPRGKRRVSRLARLVPEIGDFFTELDMRSALLEYNAAYGFAERSRVAPSFNDVRLVLNIAQLQAITPALRLMTFDGDCTLYEDGANFDRSDPLVGQMIQLLRFGIKVALVTAAGYPSAPEKYTERLAGLQQAMLDAPDLTDDQCRSLYVLGGECSYLFQFTGKADGCRLRELAREEFMTSEMLQWSDADIKALMDAAHACISSFVQRLNINATIIRKPRSVGMLPRKTRHDLDVGSGRRASRRVTAELLDELALELADLDTGPISLPYTAFNGGSDIWVDVGSKQIGVQLLQAYLSTLPEQTLHVGDQFLRIGNDFATRRACTTLWVTDPAETSHMLELLLSCRKSN
ncbi:IMP-specific 5'-nucleotidase 1 [Porphyridium purpureum]|uniref:IMP-specific 5'-nucleotidase 1 n=1 Tax=Porphyridium purpureum TaxID=35688 RepID=A0A5J4Z861_PORPP|nr:IMP-specific 5'-nucleotidase 1 [Porphyridium purpureum]|eukprot:POR3089..scf295_1